MTVRILQGDVFEQLATLPDESVHCVVTSPPYWGLRDYGVPGQIGLEPTLGEHFDVMVQVFAEVWRVLRDDGTLWLNYGDCYATAPNGRSAAATKAAGNDDRTFRDKPFSTVGPIYDPAGGGYRGNNLHNARATLDGRVVAGRMLKPKDLCMIPNRLAIALQEWGWWVRSEIIWAKPNPMPESARDRPTSAHEKIWLLTKSAKYWYDADAVRQPSKDPGRVVSYDGSQKNTGHENKTYPGATARDIVVPEKANLRNVWNIATRPYSEAHFATFPPEIPERCIKAGCPEGGTVLDPFGGAGTTGLVADRLKREAILIEINPEYAEMARRRIAGDAPLFTDVEVSESG